MSNVTVTVPNIKKIAGYSAPFTLPIALVALGKFTYAFAGVDLDVKGAAILATVSLISGLVIGTVAFVNTLWD